MVKNVESSDLPVSVAQASWPVLAGDEGNAQARRPLPQRQKHNFQGHFERGAVILSIDTEQMWGYLDLLTEQQFEERFPGATGAHEKLLARLRAAHVSATWFVVGGLALRQNGGAGDPRMAGLPGGWTDVIPNGSETTAPLWYRRSFVERLRDALPLQEIGLHGGLTHFIWTDPRATQEVARWELAEGIKALEQAQVTPCSFSFGRNQEAYHELLPAHGIRCYRGCPPALAFELGPTLPGAMLRILDEVARVSPPLIQPHETLPGLWNIPSSLFLYPIGPTRTRITGLQSRVARFHKGLEAAARHRGIFHFSLHPENLAESRHGFSVFDDILDRLVQARDGGDIEILTMSDAANRMEPGRERPAAAIDTF